MEYHIELLIHLQKLDLCIQERKKFLEDLPGMLAQADQEIKEAQDKLAAQEECLDQTRKSLRRAERGLEDGEEKLKQAYLKLQNAKTNREYEAGLKEIEEQKQRNSRLEEEALTLMDEVEAMEEELKRVTQETAAVKASLEKRKQELLAHKARALEQISQAEFERKKVAPDLPPDVLEHYERVRAHFGDPAVVRAEAEVCTACHFRIPAQTYNEVLKGERIIKCSNCQRILIAREKDLKDELEPFSGDLPAE